MLFNYLLLFVLTRVAFGWNHIPSAELKAALASSSKGALVAFVAPWTEASKSLEPEWLHSAEDSLSPMHSIDCTSGVSFCKDQEIISYPTIRLLRQGPSDKYTVERYRGPRRSAAISAYLKRIFGETQVLNAKDIREYKTKDDIVFIAYTDRQNEVLGLNFDILAKRHRDRFTFGTADQTLAKSEGISPGCVVRYKKSDVPQSICGEWKLDALQQFIEQAAAPLVGEITRRNELKYLRSGKSLVYIFAETEEERNGFKSTLNELAKQYVEYLSFVTIDAEEYRDMVPALGLRPGIYPALSLQNPSVGQVFPFEQGKKITEKTVEKFVLDIVEGRIQPGPRSQHEKTGHTEL